MAGLIDESSSISNPLGIPGQDVEHPSTCFRCLGGFGMREGGREPRVLLMQSGSRWCLLCGGMSHGGAQSTLGSMGSMLWTCITFVCVLDVGLSPNFVRVYVLLCVVRSWV